MKLYYSKGACSLAIRITLYEIGIACDFEAVNLQTKKTETGADFLTINSKGAVPTLVLDNKEVLTENAMLQQYLADMHMSPLLPPMGDLERYRVLEWLSVISSDLHKGCGPLFNSKLPQEIKDEFFVPILKNKISWVNQKLENKKYLQGDTFTVADSYLFVVLSWLPHFKLALSEWPNVSRYFSEVKNRPAVQKALKEEGL